MFPYHLNSNTNIPADSIGSLLFWRDDKLKNILKTFLNQSLSEKALKLLTLRGCLFIRIWRKGLVIL